jgi:nucleoside phosphorylase
MGEGTLTAATLTERVLSWLEPEAVLFVGVAGGLKDDIEIGDVVVATKVYAIHGGKQTPDGFLDRPEAWRASHRLEQAAKEALRGRAHFKPIAVGDVVLTDADSDLTAHIKRTYNDAVAIEMESSGVAHAVHLAGDAGALIIRGISDKANADKSTEDGKGSQPRAAANAAAAAVALLRELEPKPTGLSYRADHSSLRRSAVSPPPTKRSDSSVQTQVQVHGLVRPVMLPPRLPDFIGRSAELDRLLALLAPAPDNHSSGIPLLVAAVTGMGGIGKTALAVEAAHRAQAMGWFPGGAIFINLQGYDDDPLTADQAVVPLLRLLGTHEQAVPERKEHQYDAYRTLLAHREDRMLLILDNASLPSQYLPLLPGTDHHRVLITSRDRPNALPVRVIDLEALAPDESVALVTGALHDANERDDRPSREPDALRELTALCGHLPLALQMAAALLRRRRYRGIATLVAEMKEAETPTSVLNSARLGTDAYGRALGNLPSVTPVTATEAEPIQVNRDADAAIPMSARVTRVIRIGITGHRELPETVLPTVRAGIREALRGSTPAGALSTPAPGAAHLFTTIVLEYGVPLTSVIPGMDYERHLGDDAARASYRQLLRFCTERVELPYEPTHEEAYFAAGRYIVDHSDLLIAVWDGRPADGMDRTADVVAYARQTGVPVTVLWKPGVRRA